MKNQDYCGRAPLAICSKLKQLFAGRGVFARKYGVFRAGTAHAKTVETVRVSSMIAHH
jgi:hypothetical protein